MTQTVGHLDLDAVVLAGGPHGRRVDGVSLLEAAAWWAGERHTDAPACVSPLVATFARSWAGALDDGARQQLKTRIPALAATAAGADGPRLLLAVDWLVRDALPAFLTAAGLTAAAQALSGAAAVDGWASAVRLEPACARAAAAAHAELQAAWSGRGDSSAPAAAARACAASGADAAAAAAREALATPDPAGLTQVLAEELDAVCSGRPIGARLLPLALDAVTRPAVEAVAAAALIGALRAPPGAAAAELRPTVRQLQAGAYRLLDRLCAAGTKGA